MGSEQVNSPDFPSVGRVTYRLEPDWLNKTDAVYIERCEVMGHFKDRAAARRWMLDNEEARMALDGGRRS